MGLGFSQDDQVQQLFEFRKLTTDQEEFEIPEKPENRTQTDKPWIIAFIVVLVVLIPFLIYTLIYTELRQQSGSDNCANFCGYKNAKYEEWPCTGKDYTDQKYEYITGTTFVDDNEVSVKECVSSCPNDTELISYTCLPKISPYYRQMSMKDLFAKLEEIGQDIGRGWWAIILSAIVSGLICFGALSLFKYAVDFVVWFILIASIGALGIVAVLSWYVYFYLKNNPNYTLSKKGDSALLTLAIVCSFFGVFLLIVITCLIKRVKLIIALFKEAGKAIFDVPSLMVMPVYTSIMMTLTFLIFILLTFFMVQAGKLTEIFPDLPYLAYRLDVVMIITLAYNTFVYIWAVNFIVGCQYITVAGAISSWFFSRNKHQLEAPLWKSFTNLTRFHLGTIALGSLILALMSIVRGIIRNMAQNPRTKWLIECCLERIEDLVRFLSKNAYIQTAMHGQPFITSGKRAAILLVSNAVNVLAVNSIGDFILGVAQLLVIVIASGAGTLIAMSTGVENYWVIAVVCAFIAAFITYTYFSIFQTTIDCIFICFCEDTTLNDGMVRPYFMSKGLMQFIEDSKVIMPEEE